MSLLWDGLFWSPSPCRENVSNKWTPREAENGPDPRKYTKRCGQNYKKKYVCCVSDLFDIPFVSQRVELAVTSWSLHTVDWSESGQMRPITDFPETELNHTISETSSQIIHILWRSQKINKKNINKRHTQNALIKTCSHTNCGGDPTKISESATLSLASIFLVWQVCVLFWLRLTKTWTI